MHARIKTNFQYSLGRTNVGQRSVQRDRIAGHYVELVLAESTLHFRPHVGGKLNRLAHFARRTRINRHRRRIFVRMQLIIGILVRCLKHRIVERYEMVQFR